ncbi:MAG TPA: hypothetical protein VFB42_02620 [Gaiellaceae bacterium]|nr:hypothetical protein [Gaiellaceae bacterium]
MRIVASAALAAIALAAVGAAGVAGAASSAPSAHDRALARQVDAMAATFAGLSSRSDDLDKTLAKCSFAKGKDPSQALAATVALLPALLIEAVNDFKPQLVSARRLLASMHPDSKLFARWLDAEAKSVAFLLRFDNGGKPVDLCKAAQVLLAKDSTPAEIREVLGIDPTAIAKAFTGSASSAGDTVTRLNPRMRTFFVRAGLSKKHAAALTS